MFSRQESFYSRSSSPVKETSEHNGAVSNTSISKQIKSVLKTPRKEPKSEDTKRTKELLEEESSPGVVNAIEETIANIVHQVDKAMEEFYH